MSSRRPRPCPRPRVRHLMLTNNNSEALIMQRRFSRYDAGTGRTDADGLRTRTDTLSKIPIPTRHFKWATISRRLRISLNFHLDENDSPRMRVSAHSVVPLRMMPGSAGPRTLYWSPVCTPAPARARPRRRHFPQSKALKASTSKPLPSLARLLLSSETIALSAPRRRRCRRPRPSPSSREQWVRNAHAPLLPIYAPY